jgi:hypothetical protein
MLTPMERKAGITECFLANLAALRVADT